MRSVYQLQVPHSGQFQANILECLICLIDDCAVKNNIILVNSHISLRIYWV